MTLSPLEKGIAERERLRDDRIKNYDAKVMANFTCAASGCNVSESLLVVMVDGAREPRCPRHIGRRKPCPGQRPEILP